MIVEVRKQTFDDMIQDTAIPDLPVVFKGSLEESIDFMKSQEGYVRKDAPKLLFGAYWYNRDQSSVLLLT